MNLNTRQVLAIIGVILGVLMASTAQLTDLLGPTVAKSVVGIAGMIASGLNGVLAVLSGQANTVKEVAAMPGVEEIKVNKDANQILSAVAMDEKQDKVVPIPAQQDEIQKKAES